jgi:hypothetical protein
MPDEYEGASIQLIRAGQAGAEAVGIADLPGRLRLRLQFLLVRSEHCFFLPGHLPTAALGIYGCGFDSSQIPVLLSSQEIQQFSFIGIFYKFQTS